MSKRSQDCFNAPPRLRCLKDYLSRLVDGEKGLVWIILDDLISLRNDTLFRRGVDSRLETALPVISVLRQIVETFQSLPIDMQEQELRHIFLDSTQSK